MIVLLRGREKAALLYAIYQLTSLGLLSSHYGCMQYGSDPQILRSRTFASQVI